MAHKVLGLDVDCSHIKGAQVSRQGRSKVVTEFVSVPLPPEILVDGKVVGNMEFARALTSLIKEHDFSGEKVILGIRGPWITVKTHRLPNMNHRELEKTLEFEIPNLVSFEFGSLKDISYDFFINSQTEKDLEVVLVACPRKFLDPYIAAMHRAGLTLSAIDLPALSWPRLLPPGGKRAFVEICELQTTIFVAIAGVFKVYRVVPVGAAQFKEGIQQAFRCEAEDVQRLLSKHHVDYLLLEGPGQKRTLRAVVQQLIGSILQTLDFVRAQERATLVRSMLDELILVGDLAGVTGLDTMFAKEIGLTVSTLKTVEGLQIGVEALRPGRFSCFGSALGLALRGFEK